MSFLAFKFYGIHDFSRKEGVFEQLAELFKNYIYNNTVITNTLLVTTTRLVHRLPKASKCSLTPVQAPQRLLHIWQPLFELHRDCYTFGNPHSSSTETAEG